MAGAVVLAVIGLVVVGLSAGVASGQPTLTPTPTPAPPTSVPTPQFPFSPAPAPITPTPTVTPTPSPPPIYAEIFVPPSPPILSVTPDSPVPQTFSWGWCDGCGLCTRRVGCDLIDEGGWIFGCRWGRPFLLVVLPVRVVLCRRVVRRLVPF